MIINIIHIPFPPTILGLIIFTFCLLAGIIKEEWIKDTTNLLLNNMPLLFVPFLVGIISYKDLILKNWLTIFLTVFITTTLIIVIVGSFVEYGIKLVRLYKIRKVNKND
jgi:holin-like protein